MYKLPIGRVAIDAATTEMVARRTDRDARDHMRCRIAYASARALPLSLAACTSFPAEQTAGAASGVTRAVSAARCPSPLPAGIFDFAF